MNKDLLYEEINNYLEKYKKFMTKDIYITVKMYDTFIICGMNFKAGIKINRLYSLIIILSSSIISFLIWIVLSIFELLPWKNMSFSNSMLVYIIVNIIFNFSISNF